ncbi:MAG: hypothetical protein ACLPZR_26505 [Solirubrobacteraceae bacterium]
MAIDSTRFVAALRRLTPEAGDPGDLTGALVHDAWVAGIAMLVRSVGPDLARADVIGTQLTYSSPNGGFDAIRRARVVAARPGVASVLADLEAYEEATIELTVRLDADARPFGVVELIFSISRRPEIRAPR